MTSTSRSDLPIPAHDLWLGSSLGWATAFAVVLIPLSLVLLVLDPRILDDEALWLKPLKFQISMAVLTGTLLLALATSGLGTSIWVRIPALAMAAAAFYELTFLDIQAARGVRSHFNADTLFDRVGGTVMAGGAGVLVLGAALIGMAILIGLAFKGRAAIDEPVVLALGLVLGGLLGGYTGSAIGANRGPFVGDAAGPFLPLMGWSLTGGDLRVAHFLGLHAMQALPLFALAVRAALPGPAASLAVLVGAGTWSALTLAVMRAAQMGEGLSLGAADP